MDLRKIQVLDMLTALGIRNVTDEGEEIRYSCPFPDHANADETASAYMNAETTAYFCHGCHSKGNAVYFLAKYEGITPLLAARFLRERYDQGFIDPGDNFEHELESVWVYPDIESDPVNEPIDYEMGFLPPDAEDYMLSRGFTRQTLEAWEIGYDSISNRIAIPIRDHHGRMIGFKGRSYTPNHNPKYLVLGDKPNRSPRYGFPTYEVSRVAFGYHVARLGDSKRLVLCEGELDVIALHQMGVTDAIAVGSNVSEFHCSLILSYADEIVIFFDDDKAGYSGAAKAVAMLDSYIPVRIVAEHDSDPCGLPSDQCLTLISEARSTNEIWLPSLNLTE